MPFARVCARSVAHVARALFGRPLLEKHAAQSAQMHIFLACGTALGVRQYVGVASRQLCDLAARPQVEGAPEPLLFRPLPHTHAYCLDGDDLLKADRSLMPLAGCSLSGLACKGGHGLVLYCA